MKLCSYLVLLLSIPGFAAASDEMSCHAGVPFQSARKSGDQIKYLNILVKEAKRRASNPDFGDAVSPDDKLLTDAAKIGNTLTPKLRNGVIQGGSFDSFNKTGTVKLANIMHDGHLYVAEIPVDGVIGIDVEKQPMPVLAFQELSAHARLRFRFGSNPVKLISAIATHDDPSPPQPEAGSPILLHALSLSPEAVTNHFDIGRDQQLRLGHFFQSDTVPLKEDARNHRRSKVFPLEGLTPDTMRNALLEAMITSQVDDRDCQSPAIYLQNYDLIKKNCIGEVFGILQRAGWRYSGYPCRTTKDDEIPSWASKISSPMAKSIRSVVSQRESPLYIPDRIGCFASGAEPGASGDRNATDLVWVSEFRASTPAPSTSQGPPGQSAAPVVDFEKR